MLVILGFCIIFTNIHILNMLRIIFFNYFVLLFEIDNKKKGSTKSFFVFKQNDASACRI
jgi:hypothetical protein